MTHFLRATQTRVLVYPILLVMAALLLTACSGRGKVQLKDVPMAPLAGMPKEVQTAPANVRQAYQFALANPDSLKAVPCYCGCGAVGHTSNYSCFVKEAKASGETVFDRHALGCSICVDIALDVMRLDREGKPAQEVRAYIDQTYGQYGPSNMPPAQ